MKICGVYAITCKANGKCYVGSSVNIEQRWREHRRRLKLGQHWNQRLQNAWNKYGEEAFHFGIIQRTAKEHRITCEMRWCRKLEPGFNKAKPDEGLQHWLPSDEGRERQAAAQRGKPKSFEMRRKISLANANRSPEMKARISAMVTEMNHAREGKDSPETRWKKGAYARNNPQSPEHTAKIAAANRERYQTPEGKTQLDKARKVRRLGMEWRAKLSEAAKQRHATGCPNGHPYTPENTSFRKNGSRACKICLRATRDRSNKRRREMRSISRAGDPASSG